MSKKFKMVKRFFDAGMWNAEMVYNAVVKEWITAEEYEEFVENEAE